MSNTWITSNNVITARRFTAGFGAQQDALVAGGDNLSSVEKRTGTTWATLGSGSLLEIRTGHAGAGTTAAGLVCGGGTSSSEVATTETFNGTTWSTAALMTSARRFHTGFGIQSAAVVAGGSNSAPVNTSESYNGASWTSGASMSAARRSPSSAGIDSSGLVFGGENGTNALSSTETYNGSTFGAGSPLSLARFQLGGAGISSSSAVSFGGQTTGITTSGGAVVNTTEMYNGTWSVGGNMNVSRTRLGSAGTRTSGLSIAGWDGTALSQTTEEFLGLSVPPVPINVTATVI